MKDEVSILSRITFGNNVETFDLPDTLLINPALILDETQGVYRLSIGIVKEPLNEVADVYQRLFNALDKHMPFVENMHVIVNDEKLTFTLAYIMKYEKPFGMFYEIEATEKYMKYTEGINNGHTTS